MPRLKLKSPITQVPMVGDEYAKKLQKLEIKTVEDLLHHYPARYIDRSLITKINTLQESETVTITATIVNFKNIYTKFGKNLQTAVVADDTGQITITWFNQQFLSRTLQPGLAFAFSGKIKSYRNKLTLQSPEAERVDTPSANIHTGRLVPVYPETARVSSKWLRSRINHTFKLIQITDHLPDNITKRHRLNSLADSLRQIHFPKSSHHLAKAKTRLAFDELFFLQLQGALKRKAWHQKTTLHQLTINKTLTNKFISSLSFKLTSAQNKAVKEILSDLNSANPMNRLLEGDVGSGKTVVAAIAAYTSFTNHKKSLLMAPTEILANQHFKELKKLFGKTKLKIGLQTGSTKTKGDFDLTIGTHALLHKKPDPKESSKLALVIIDEQHRFGVAQRAKLENLGKNPHRLTMSATPIPRTVALTLYGDLDVSIIDELPHGRLPVKTWIVPHHKREAAYDWIKTQISKLKAQVFVVCPLIDPSESVKLQQVRSAKQEFDHLKKVFPKKKISLLHGKIKAKEKDQVITNFKQAKSDILVATPVIEVGIDIPAATIMLIEGAERFGLAQLHQLRGRVGRGDHQSYCLLFSSIENKTQNQRLKSLTRENSGFKLAKIDLKIRGPGEVFGATQHGFRDLKIARLSDSKLLKNTKLEAQNLIKTDPNFKNHPFLKQKLEENDAVAVAPN